MKLILLLSLLFLGSCSNSSGDCDLNWEAVTSNWSLDTVYRARVYGGWLVTYRGSITFMPLNKPDNWILKSNGN
jgi:hypothetical protein